MPINVKYIKVFLDNVIAKNSEKGLILNEVAVLYNELNVRRSLREKALPVNFYPIVELYCVFLDKEATVEVSGSVRRIRGFGFKTTEIDRLVNIFVNGTGASPENIGVLNELFKPLIGISENDPLP